MSLLAIYVEIERASRTCLSNAHTSCRSWLQCLSLKPFYQCDILLYGNVTGSQTCNIQHHSLESGRWLDCKVLSSYRWLKGQALQILPELFACVSLLSWQSWLSQPYHCRWWEGPSPNGKHPGDWIEKSSKPILTSIKIFHLHQFARYQACRGLSSFSIASLH